MWHRAERSAVFAVVWVILAFAVALPGLTTPAHAGQLTIRFNELAAYAAEHSPRARAITNELSVVEAQRRRALQWSNPRVAYDHEEVGDVREWQLTLHKSLVAPLSQRRSRSAWRSRVEEARLRGDHDTAVLLAELKSGYVRLSLLDVRLEHLDRLDGAVEKVSAGARARYAEGELSGVERHLIQLTALSLKAGRRDALVERHALAASLRALLGVSATTQLQLATPIAFREVSLASPDEFVDRFAGASLAQSRAQGVKALAGLSRAASPGLVPELDAYAGLKQIDDADGFVAGIALSLPLFNRNAGAVQELEAQRRILESEAQIEHTIVAGEIESLVRQIDDLGAMLTLASGIAAEAPAMTEGLFESYSSGRLTLDAFLNSIQIQVSGTNDYYRQLAMYYDNVFRLEALTDVEIVTFAQ